MSTNVNEAQISLEKAIEQSVEIQANIKRVKQAREAALDAGMDAKRLDGAEKLLKAARRSNKTTRKKLYRALNVLGVGRNEILAKSADGNETFGPLPCSGECKDD